MLSSKAKAHWAVVGSVIGFACIPVTIKQTAFDSNPFFFNALATATQSLALGVWLHWFTPRVFPGRRGLLEPLSHYRRTQTQQKASTKGHRLLLGVAALPLIWLVISRLEYAFFAWSALYVDTAITAALFRLWPLIMVLFLAGWAIRMRHKGQKGGGAEYRIAKRNILAMVAASAGALVVVLSAASPSPESGGGADGWIAGVALALVGAVLAGLSPAASLAFGDKVSRLLKTKPGAKKQVDAKQMMWLAVFAYALSAAVVVPFNLIWGLGLGGQLTAKGVLGALLVGGLMSGLGALLLRVANSLTSDLSINAIFQSMPILSLLLLALAGISIPRMDLFVAGTAIMVVSALVIELHPSHWKHGPGFVGHHKTLKTER